MSGPRFYVHLPVARPPLPHIFSLILFAASFLLFLFFFNQNIYCKILLIILLSLCKVGLVVF